MNMKKIAILSVAALLTISCAKKTAEVAATKAVTTKVAAFRNTAPGAAPARPIELGKYNTFDLANGLKVIVVENHKLPVVSYQVSLLNDPILEKDQVGYVNFAGELLSKGTTTKTKAQLDEEIDYIGASLSSFSGGMFASSLKKHSPKLLDLMSDILYNPAFPKEEFEKITKQALSGLAASKTNPNAMSSNISSVVNYGANHPFGEVRTEKTVKAITLDKCKEYYNTFFKPNNAYLIIVGDITPDVAKAQAEKYFSKWQKGVIPEAKYAVPMAPKDTRVIIGHKDGAVQSVINVTYPITLKPGDPDILASTVMNSVLGGGVFSGRLMQNLRESKAYTYGARSSLSSSDLVGTFSANASVRNAVTDSSVYEFMKELDRMSTDPPKESDLSLVKNSLAGSFARSLESPQTIANFARNIFKNNLPLDYYDSYLKRLEAINLTDIQRVVKRFITPKNANIVVVGNKDDIAEKLLQFDADGEIEYYDAFGMKLDMNVKAVPSDISGNQVIEDYLAAIGGKAKLGALKGLSTTSEMTLMGRPATMTVKQAAPNKLSTVMAMNGMNMMEQKLNGDKASMSQMGQKKMMDSKDPMFASILESAAIIPQMEYMKPGYKLEVKGSETIDGQPCYKIMISKPDGTTRTELYSVKTNLLVRSIDVKGEGEKSMTQITTYSNYKDVSGYMFPHKTVLEGVMPMALEAMVKEIVVNPVFGADEFKVE